MRTLGKIAATLGVMGAIAVGGVVPTSADWYGHHHHRYFNYGRRHLEWLPARLDRARRRL
jgi:hypothetical protein